MAPMKANIPCECVTASLETLGELKGSLAGSTEQEGASCPEHLGTSR